MYLRLTVLPLNSVRAKLHEHHSGESYLMCPPRSYEVFRSTWRKNSLRTQSRKKREDKGYPVVVLPPVFEVDLVVSISVVCPHYVDVVSRN